MWLYFDVNLYGYQWLEKPVQAIKMSEEEECLQWAGTKRVCNLQTKSNNSKSFKQETFQREKTMSE